MEALEQKKEGIGMCPGDWVNVFGERVRTNGPTVALQDIEEALRQFRQQVKSGCSKRTHAFKVVVELSAAGRILSKPPIRNKLSPNDEKTALSGVMRMAGISLLLEIRHLDSPVQNDFYLAVKVTDNPNDNWYRNAADHRHP